MPENNTQMQPKKVEMDVQLVRVVINTLKLIEVRNFDSMDKLVGLVKLFNELQAIAMTANTPQKNEPVKEEHAEQTEEMKGGA